MARVFVTGSTTGLGLAAVEAMLDDGHEVVLHARKHHLRIADEHAIAMSVSAVGGVARQARALRCG